MTQGSKILNNPKCSKLIKSEEYENLFLFNFMKNDVDWKCVLKLDGTYAYRNPINASYLGLMFHKEESWLHAVREKITDHFAAQGSFLEYSLEKIDTGFCYMLNLDTGEEYINLAHVHTETEFLAEKQVILQVVEFITAKRN